MFWYVLLYVVTGGLFIGLGIPLARRKVKPNGWYGFRVPSTLNNLDVWYPANAYAGKLLVAVGILLAVAAILLALVPGLDTGAYVLVLTSLLVLILLVAVVLCFRYLRTLTRNSAPK